MIDPGYLVIYGPHPTSAERRQRRALVAAVPACDLHWWPRTGRLWVAERHAGVLRALLSDRDELDDESRAVLGGQGRLELETTA